MNKDFNRTFDKCPCCESTNRFFEQLGQELIDRKLTGDKWYFSYESRSGPVVDQTKEPAYPIGTEVPTYGITTDVCMDCGCMYAIRLDRGNITKPAPPLINRAQRRRDMREQGGGGLVIPGG